MLILDQHSETFDLVGVLIEIKRLPHIQSRTRWADEWLYLLMIVLTYFKSFLFVKELSVCCTFVPWRWPQAVLVTWSHDLKSMQTIECCEHNVLRSGIKLLRHFECLFFMSFQFIPNRRNYLVWYIFYPISELLLHKLGSKL